MAPIIYINIIASYFPSFQRVAAQIIVGSIIFRA